MTHRQRLELIADCIATRDFADISETEWDIVEKLVRKAEVLPTVRADLSERDRLIVEFCHHWLPAKQGGEWGQAGAFLRLIQRYQLGRWREDARAGQNPYQRASMEHGLWRIMNSAPLRILPATDVGIWKILTKHRN